MAAALWVAFRAAGARVVFDSARGWGGKRIVVGAALGYEHGMVVKGFVGVAGLAWVAGCTSTSSLLATLFSKQHACQESLVRVREAGGSEYEAEGCGYRTRYICGSFASDRGCVEQGVVPQAGTEPPRRSPTPGYEDPPK
jgi:hypothetical protein